MFEITTVSLNGLDFTVGCAGPAIGTLVLLLHGFPQTHRMWQAQLEALAAAGYRAFAPDQRGYSPGARSPGAAPYATTNIINDALALMTSFGADQFYFVGHDWGGHFVVDQYPARVSVLLLDHFEGTALRI